MPVTSSGNPPKAASKSQLVDNPDDHRDYGIYFDDVDDCHDHLSFLGGDVVVVVTGAVVGPSTFQIISIVCTIILIIGPQKFF